MILKTFITQYINEENVEDIVFHSGSIIIKDTFKIIGLLIIFYGLFYVLKIYIQLPILPRIFGIVGIILLIKLAIDIFDKSVDCMILSKTGITFFSRDGVFKYKTEFFGRNSIETISHQQNTFRDKIFLRGDIKIQLEHDIIYDFEQVGNPKKQVKRIMKIKDQHFTQNEKEFKKDIDHSQSNALSEAISDVIKDYLNKN